MVKAFSPQEASINKSRDMPAFVISAFNILLTKEFHPRAGYAIIHRDHILEEIIKQSPTDITIDEIYKLKYLDIEQIYDLQSWIVKFDIEHQYFEFRSKHVL